MAAAVGAIGAPIKRCKFKKCDYEGCKNIIPIHAPHYGSILYCGLKCQIPDQPNRIRVRILKASSLSVAAGDLKVDQKVAKRVLKRLLG